MEPKVQFSRGKISMKIEFRSNVPGFLPRQSQLMLIEIINKFIATKLN